MQKESKDHMLVDSENKYFLNPKIPPKRNFPIRAFLFDLSHKIQKFLTRNFSEAVKSPIGKLAITLCGSGVLTTGLSLMATTGMGY